MSSRRMCLGDPDVSKRNDSVRGTTQEGQKVEVEAANSLSREGGQTAACFGAQISRASFRLITPALLVRCEAVEFF